MCPPKAQAESPDRVLRPAEVLSIVRRYVPGAQGLTGIDESGRKGRVYYIDDDLVLKTHRPARLRGRMVEEFDTSLAKEAFFLRAIEGGGGEIRAPRFLGYGREGETEYLCMTRLRGVSLGTAALEGLQRFEVLRSLGRALARLHGLAQGQFLESGLFSVDATAAALKGRMALALAEVAAVVNGLPSEARIDRDPMRVAEAAVRLLPDSLSPVALHSNPASEHVFVDPDTGEFAGLIDFADAYISHPAFDLRPWRRRDEREAVLAGYAEAAPVDDAFLGAMKAAMLLGELAYVTRRRAPPSQSEAVIDGLLEG